MELYERIEETCRLRGMSVTQMCREAAISRAAISDLKHGRSKNLSLKTICKLCEMFGVSIGYWLDPQRAGAKERM